MKTRGAPSEVIGTIGTSEYLVRRAPDEPGQLQLGMCTREPGCAAAANQHEPDCPVEQQLKEEFGF